MKSIKSSIQEFKYSSIQVFKYSLFKYSSIQVFKYRVYKLVTHYTLHIITYNVKTRDPIGSKNTITWKITEMTRESVRTQMKKTSSSLFSARAAR